MLMFRNKVGGEEEERRHSLFDAEFIQKLLFTARTKISIQLFISGSLDNLNNWKRDLEGALTPACMATALPQIPSERSRHIFDCQSSDAGWTFFLGDIHTGFRLPDMVHRKDLPPTTHSDACSSLPVWPYCSSPDPKISIKRRSQT